MGVKNFRELAEQLPEVFTSREYARSGQDVVGLARTIASIVRENNIRYLPLDGTAFLGSFAHRASNLSHSPFPRFDTPYLLPSSYTDPLTRLTNFVRFLLQLAPELVVAVFFDGEYRSLAKQREEEERMRANAEKMHEKRREWQAGSPQDRVRRRGAGDLLFEVPPEGMPDEMKLPATSGFDRPAFNRDTLERAAAVSDDAAWLLDPSNRVLVLDSPHEADPAIPHHLGRIFASTESCGALFSDILHLYHQRPPLDVHGQPQPVPASTSAAINQIAMSFTSFEPAQVLPVSKDSDIHFGSSSALARFSLSIQPATKDGSVVIICDRHALEQHFGGLPPTGEGSARLALLLGQDYSGGGVVQLGPARLVESAHRIGTFCRATLDNNNYQGEIHQLLDDLNAGRSLYSLSTDFPADFSAFSLAEDTLRGAELAPTDLFRKRHLVEEIWASTRTPSQRCPTPSLPTMDLDLPLHLPFPSPPSRGLEPERGVLRPPPRSTTPPPRPLRVALYPPDQLSPLEAQGRRRRTAAEQGSLQDAPLSHRLEAEPADRAPAPQLISVRQLDLKHSPLKALLRFLAAHPNAPPVPPASGAPPRSGGQAAADRGDQPDEATEGGEGQRKTYFRQSTTKFRFPHPTAQQILDPALPPLLVGLHRLLFTMIVPFLHLVVTPAFSTLSTISPFSPEFVRALANPHDFARSLLRVMGGELDERGKLSSRPRIARKSVGYAAPAASRVGFDAAFTTLTDAQRTQLLRSSLPLPVFDLVERARTNFAPFLATFKLYPLRQFFERAVHQHADGVAARLPSSSSFPAVFTSLLRHLLSDPSAASAPDLDHLHHSLFPDAQPRPPPSALRQTFLPLLPHHAPYSASVLAASIAQVTGLFEQLGTLLSKDAAVLDLPLAYGAAQSHIQTEGPPLAYRLADAIYFDLHPHELETLTVVVQLLLALVFDLCRAATLATVAHAYDHSVSPAPAQGRQSAYSDDRDAPFRLPHDPPPIPSSWSAARLNYLAQRALLLLELDSAATAAVNDPKRGLPLILLPEELELRRVTAASGGRGATAARREVDLVDDNAKLEHYLAHGTFPSGVVPAWASGHEYWAVREALRGLKGSPVGYGEGTAARLWLEGLGGDPAARLRTHFYPRHLPVVLAPLVDLIALLAVDNKAFDIVSSAITFASTAPLLSNHVPAALTNYIHQQGALSPTVPLDQAALLSLLTRLYAAYQPGSPLASVSSKLIIPKTTRHALVRAIEAGTRLPALRELFPGLADALPQGHFTFTPTALHVLMIHPERVTQAQFAQIGPSAATPTVREHLESLHTKPTSLSPLFKLSAPKQTQASPPSSSRSPTSELSRAINSPALFPLQLLARPLHLVPTLATKPTLPSLPDLETLSSALPSLKSYLHPTIRHRFADDVDVGAIDGGKRCPCAGVSDRAGGAARTVVLKKGVFESTTANRASLRALRFPPDEPGQYHHIDLGIFESSERATAQTAANPIQPDERDYGLASFDISTASKHDSLYDRIAHEASIALFPPRPGPPRRILLFFGLGNTSRLKGWASDKDVALLRHLLVALRARADVVEVKVVGIDEFRTSSVCPDPECYGGPLLASYYDTKQRQAHRVKFCETCQQTFHRDIVGAVNILKVGIATVLYNLPHILREPYAVANGLTYPPKRPDPQPPLRPSS